MTVVTRQQLTSVYTGIAAALGAPEDEARVFARCMARADLRGMYTQGAAIIPYTVWMVEQGLMRFGVPFTILHEAAGMALIDGGYGVGSVVATRAMDLAIRKAKQAGVAGVWVQHGGDFMMTANHPMQALEHDQVGITMRNENPRVAPWGGREAFFFTNPISVAIPTDKEPPIVIDMAGGSASVGAVVMAARDAKLLPTPQLVTADGVYTDDPRQIVIDPMDRESGFRGGIVTLGHKGLMWSLIVELFSGLLSGTQTSNQNDYEPTRERPWDSGQFHLAIDVGKLRPVAEFKAAADGFARSLRSVKPAKGFEQVIVPGEVEAQREAERMEKGVPIRDEDWEGVVKVATRLGVEVGS